MKKKHHSIRNRVARTFIGFKRYAGRKRAAKQKSFNAAVSAMAILCLLFGQVVGFAKPLAAQSELVSIGILSFQDESGIGAPIEIGRRVARDLQQRVALTYKDVLPRLIGSEIEVASGKALTVEQVVALGKQNGVRFVIRGGLLALTADNDGEQAQVSVQLYAEIISVESFAVTSARAEGTGAQDGTTASEEVDWNSINFASAEFRNTSLGQAFSGAIERLAEAIYQAIASPIQDAIQSDEQPDSDASQDEALQTEDQQAAEADEELQQLIAQAETIMADSSTVSAEGFDSLVRSLESLQSALASKVTLMESGEDTTDADRQIAARKEELQATISTLTQQISSGDVVATEDQSSSGEKKSMLARMDGYLGDALNMIQKIQAIRAALRGENNSPSFDEGFPVDSNIEDGLPVEEPTEEIGGVITESGIPVEGVTITELESGVSAITDSDGSYTLKGVAGGKIAKLVLAKGGKQLASDQIYLSRNRAALADFELKSQSATKARPALKVIPSTVKVNAIKSRGGDTGALKGIVRDAQDRPIARALVNLKGIAVARTDSEGRYSFLNVPAGIHQLTVRKSGLNLKSESVQVAANRSSESKIQFASNPTIPKRRSPQPLKAPSSHVEKSLESRRSGGSEGRNHDTGFNTPIRPVEVKRGRLSGRVVDAQSRKPISGAVVSVGGQRSVRTDAQGNYEIVNLTPGSYTISIEKTNFSDQERTIKIAAGNSTRGDFFLRAKSDRVIVRPQLPAARVTVRKGQVRGRITDAKTGKPIAGANVSLSGAGSATTNREGVYSIGDLSPGVYQLIIRKSGFSDGKERLTIKSGETATLSLRLNSNPKPPVRSRFSISRPE